VLSQREFRKLLVGSFISQIGSHLLTLSLSAYILLQTGSPLDAALVFVLTFLPAAFVSDRVGHWIDRHLGRFFLIRNELFSVGLTLLCGICVRLHSSVIFLGVALSIRSIFLFIGRSAIQKWIKHISPNEIQASRFKLHSFNFFLSTLVSGLLATVLLSRVSMSAIIIIDAASFILGICVYALLQPLQIKTALSERLDSIEYSTRYGIGIILRSSKLRSLFFIVCVSQALFQGAYSVLVSVLPVDRLSMGLQGVGFFQLAASLGIIAGFFLVWKKPRFLLWPNRRITNFVVWIAGLCSLLLCALSPWRAGGLFFFFMMNFAYESLWLSSHAEFFKESVQEQVGLLSFTLVSWASSLMAIATLVYAFSIQELGIRFGTIVFLFFMAVVVSVVYLPNRNRELVNLSRGEAA